MIDAQLRLKTEQRLREAAVSLREDYLNDPELTVFSAIEGDALHEEG